MLAKHLLAARGPDVKINKRTKERGFQLLGKPVRGTGLTLTARVQKLFLNTENLLIRRISESLRSIKRNNLT